MLRIAAILGFSVLVFSPLSAADFSVHIVSAPQDVPRGAPILILVETRNVSGHSIVVAGGAGGFQTTFQAVRSDGRPLKKSTSEAEGSYRQGFVARTLSPEWTQTRHFELTSDDDPGELIVQAKISCHGPYPVYERGEKTGQFEAWSGEIKSEERHIRLTAPQGLDLQAFNALNKCPMCAPAKLLERFPTSTYAGYALAHSGPSQALWSFTCLNDPDGELRKYSDMGGGEDNLRRRIAKTQAELQAYAKIAGPFLMAHPDFVYALLIRRMYAMCLGLTGHMPEAMAEIQTLSTGDGKEAAEAKAFLGGKASAKSKSQQLPGSHEFNGLDQAPVR